MLAYLAAFASPIVIGVFGYKLVALIFRSIDGSGWHRVLAVVVTGVLAMALIGAVLSLIRLALVGAYLHPLALKQTRTVPGSGDATEMDSLALNDNGSLLAGGDAGGHVCIWATAGGRLVRTLRNPIGYVVGGTLTTDVVDVQAIPGSSALLDGDDLGNLPLWNLSDLPGIGAWNKPATDK